MAMPIFKERRLITRRKLSGLMPGPLTSELGEPISCRPFDISRIGLGVICQAQLAIQSSLVLKIKSQVVNLRVLWGQPDFGKRNLFRYGLEVVDQGIDLEQIFVDTHCLE